MVQGQKSIEKPDKNNCNASATAEPKELQVLFPVPREQLHDMTEELSLQAVH